MRAVGIVAMVLWMAFVSGCGGNSRPGPKGPSDMEVEEPPEPPPADMGSLPADKVEELNDYFTKKGAQVARCYQKEVERRGDRSFVGRVTVRLRIGKDGRASNIQVTETTLKSPPVEECIMELIRGWAMPELPNPVIWTWTFEFQPAW